MSGMEFIDQEEMNAAEEIAHEDNSGTYTHRFHKPFAFERNSVEELAFDWDSLTGADSLAIEGELQALGKAVIVPELSGEYLIRMAVRACSTTVNGKRLGMDAFMAMPWADYNRIRSRARSYLIRASL